MSKSSKRRLAQAAIFNAQPTAATTAKSLLQAAAQTAASPQRATDIPVGVPLPSPVPSPQPSPLKSQLSTFNSPSAPSSSLPTSSLRHSAPSPLPSSPEISNLKSPSDSDSAPSLNSQLSTLNSSLTCNSAPTSSPEISNLKSPSISPPSTSPLCHSATSPLLPDPSSTPPLCHSATLPLPPASAPSTQNSALSSPPSPFFTEFLEPFCPPQQVDFIELLPIPPDPSHPSAINCQLHDYQAKLKPIFANLSPDDPNVERINHNYVIVMQIATVERLIASLPGLSEKAMVETNNQIVRMLSIIERTNSRKSRELREKDAAARRIIREQQRKERQTQRESEALARNQRTQQREEHRRQRELANAQRAQQKHELAMRKLDLKERNLSLLESETKVEANLKQNNSAKPKAPITPQPPAALSKPLPPPNSWTCG